MAPRTGKTAFMRVTFLLCLAVCNSAMAQTTSSTPSPESLFNNLPARNLGPTTMGGRIDDIAVYEKEPRIFFIATASGGLWKTTNGGLTTTPIWDRGSVAGLGAVAVCQTNPDIIWIGTGEHVSRNSTIFGAGVFKSEDGGKTWVDVGLKDTRQIGRIIIDPKDPKTVYVAALGHLWGPNNERGVFKTTDGGKNWVKVHFVDDMTGAVELVMNPKNNRELIVGMWQKQRYPWNMVSGGPGSGIYKSTDAGSTWKKVTAGLPTTSIGRIGLSYHRNNPKLVVATIENKENGGLYKSIDGGNTWKMMSKTNPRPFYFSQPRYDPSDDKRIYVPGVSTLYSDDGGENFRAFRETVHVDHHAFWIDPSDSNHIIIGEDGGVGQTRDKGATWQHVNTLPIGQFYAVAFDMRKPYYVYGGLQDNGSWGGPTQTTHGGVGFFDWYGVGGGDGFHVQVDSNDWTTVYSESQGGAVSRVDVANGGQRSIQPRPKPGEPRYRFNWSSPIVLSAWNSRIVYFGGNRLFKSIDRGDHWDAISPDLTTNDPAKQKPGEGSVTPENTGAEVHCTIITISESQNKDGILWVGTDDGQVQVSRNEGTTWTNVTANIPDLPKNAWCSRVIASKFVEGRCYATFDDHRRDNYKAYVYVTEDFGKTWKSLGGAIPENHCCEVIREGLKNENLLFLGTEAGLWMSLDRGASWTKYAGDTWPTVPVYDFVLHPRDGDLVVATHGRSLWTIPVSALEELTAANMEKDVFLAKPAPIYLLGNVDGVPGDGDGVWYSRNTQPGTQICFYCKADMGEATITVSDAAGNRVGSESTATAKAGLNVVRWTARGRMSTSDYRVTLKVKDKEYITSVRVEDIGPKE